MTEQKIVLPPGVDDPRVLGATEKRIEAGGCPNSACNGSKADFRPVFGGQEYCRLCGHQRRANG